MNKKGLMLILTIGLVLGAILLPLFFFLYKTYWDAFATNPDKQEEINEFIGIIGSIEDLIESEENEVLVSLSIDPKYALVGFNKEWDDDVKTDACPPEDEVHKPSSCEGACLCLYEDVGENFPMTDNVDCYNFPGVDFFASIPYWKPSHLIPHFKFSEQKYPGIPVPVIKNLVGWDYKIGQEEFGYMFLYGECEGWTNDDPLDAQNFIIEKREIEGQNVIIFKGTNE